jgi:FkbM family methyltransferase
MSDKQASQGTQASRQGTIVQGTGTDGLMMVDGLWWPAAASEDKAASRHGRYVRHERDSDVAIRHCRQRRVCVQAGGHVGIWPIRLSHKFKDVHTFEPEATNFRCLQLNIAKSARSNITTYNAGLDQEEGDGLMAYNARNIGGHKCRPEGYRRAEDEIVPVRMTTIDGNNLGDVDLICLDVEGYEARALRGAEKTIRRCRPVIMVEEWSHGEKIGDPAARLWAELTARGYHQVGKVSHDYVWVSR